MVNFERGVSSGKTDLLEVWKRVRKRDFSGNTGIAIKNSIFQIGTNFVSKIGSLIFTVVLARILMPELFGFYSLALSTVILFSSLANLGFNNTIIRYVSKALGRKEEHKARDYFHYVSRLNLILLLASTTLLLLGAKLIAGFYNKPIFWALVAGAAYIFFVGLARLMESVIQSVNNFRWIFTRESFVQLTRNIAVPIFVILLLKIASSSETILFGVIGILALTYLLAFLLTYVVSFRKIEFLKLKPRNLPKDEKKGINKFLISISVFSLSGLLFGYIDVMMLGYFVSGELIGYYRAAFSLIGALVPLMTVAGALFPVFSRLDKESLERGFGKSLKMISLISIVSFVILISLAPIIIRLVFGLEYSPSIQILQILSILIIMLPISSLYETYFVSKGKPKKIAKLLIISTILNIGLNLALILWLLNYSPYMAVIGVCIATILSRGFYFIFLIVERRKIYSQHRNN